MVKFPPVKHFENLLLQNSILKLYNTYNVATVSLQD
jgi:hypothetical protein